jgi:hypothetical protein
MATAASTRSIRSRSSEAGYSLAELLVSMGIMTVIMGATMGGLADVVKGNDIVLQVTSMNNSLRGGMDIIVRDLLQVGSGLPPGHTVSIPSGVGSTRVKLPGPPDTAFLTPVGAVVLGAVIPGAGQGPTINGVPTDTLTVLMTDNTFLNVGTTAVGSTYVDIAAGPNLTAGADRVTPGQLMLVMKGALTTLVEVTNVNGDTRRLTFANGDALNLNQSGAAAGNLAALNTAAPANSPANTNVSRVRMVTYYLDAKIDPKHPRLVRRINNGSATAFDNSSGTAVAIDIENLQLTYDISNGTNNPGNVEMTAGDQAAGGACGATACAATQIRKVNVLLAARSANAANPSALVYRNVLQSQVSLRGMAFVDEYRSSY